MVVVIVAIVCAFLYGCGLLVAAAIFLWRAIARFILSLSLSFLLQTSFSSQTRVGCTAVMGDCSNYRRCSVHNWSNCCRVLWLKRSYVLHSKLETPNITHLATAIAGLGLAFVIQGIIVVVFIGTNIVFSFTHTNRLNPQSAISWAGST